jgi:hypothetical protein
MSDYQSLVKAAEDAVASIKNEKLKEIAFSQVLSHLLASGKAATSIPKVPLHPRIKQKGSGHEVLKKKPGTTTWLKDLVTQGFFKTPQNAKVILEALESNSHHLSASDLTWPLQQLCHEKVLRRKKIAPEEGKRAVWHWSEW